ncbi:MAG TPA: TIGR03085 family metal-binding protein [Propionicimonas sp.]|nr:TIGR03085 family metal-binding protein [Propionicimonas sp.]
MSPKSQRDALCDALDAVHPSAPTLCEGWTAHHLAAHVWLRESDSWAVARARLTRRRDRVEFLMAEVMTQRPYPDLVAAIRRGPEGLSPFRLPGVEAAANTLEFLVHCEDVRRGSGNNTPRPTDLALEELCWKRVPLLARMVLRGCPVAVWLERDLPPGEPVRIGHGPDIVTLSGPPSELVLYLFGRRSAACVEVIGEPAAVSVLEHRTLGV